MRTLLIMLTGFAGGITSGLFGVGGGVVFVPLLFFLAGFDIHRAVATSLAIVVPTALLGVFRHARAGMVDWSVTAPIVLAALAGAWLGSGWSIRLDPDLLRRLFAVFMGVVAVKLFFQNT